MTATLEAPKPAPDEPDRGHYELRCLCGRLHLPASKEPIWCPCDRLLINQWGEE